jgi:hypothetical protein
MRMESAPLMSMACACLLGLSVALPGCGKRETVRHESFQSDTPFSAKVSGRGEDVCWSVKRALLTQG